jgi:hypothetical protein
MGISGTSKISLPTAQASRRALLANFIRLTYIFYTTYHANCRIVRRIVLLALFVADGDPPLACYAAK